MDEQDKKPSRKSAGSARWIAGGSAVTGFMAFIGASCCVLPIILVNLGLSGALVSNLAFFARAREWFLGATIIFLVSAFVLAFRGGRRPTGIVLSLLILSSVLAAGAWVLPIYEPEILRWINSR